MVSKIKNIGINYIYHVKEYFAIEFICGRIDVTKGFYIFKLCPERIKKINGYAHNIGST